MQCNHLWSVDNCGTVHSLDIKSKQWSQLSYQRLEFKRVSSSPQSIWAIGGDHQIYIYVPSNDIPIRVCDLTYENQRWNPLNQFSSSLLPTDRPQFSCADGSLALPKEGFVLPSKGWSYESDWYIETNIEGEPLEPEGWSYAIDFPMKFSSEKHWSSLVRRRRWLRFRRYVCINEWALVESIHGDFVTEPFIDISTGGYEMSGSDNDMLAVWAVTVIGRVIYRKGIDKYSPEGVSWVNVKVPVGWEVNQISCGPTGLVWAVAWDGSALVRSGVNRDTIYGNEWIRVEAPNESKLMQVSVGVDSVWALTRDGKVWFRKGIRGLNSGHNDNCAIGSGWVEMMQEMSLLSVTSNDQVWALSPDKKSLYFRTGISFGELTGKAWKLMARQPINVCNQRNAIKAIEQQLDSISISSQDSLFSSNIADSETQAWIWISAASCALNTDAYLQISCPSQESQTSLDVLTLREQSISSDECDWKSTIITQLNRRYEIEMKDFMPLYQKAIESGVWVKTGTCIVGNIDKTSTVWSPGLLELQRHGVEKTTESGTLTITYSNSSQKTKVNRKMLNLAEISCAFIDSSEHSMYSISNCLVICGNSFVTKLKFQTDTELNDWLATINLVCGDLHGINGTTAMSGALLYCLTQKGDLYVGHQLSSDNVFYYLFSGGHFKSVTTCLAISWAISYDSVLWVYNNGTGGGVYNDLTGVTSNCNPMSDTMSFCCYENQRWNPLSGFAPKGLPTDRYMWSDETGKHELIKDNIKLPSKQWQWLNDWSIDYSTPDGVDSDGWQYSIDFPFDYHSDRKFTDYVRRRRWFRKCRLTTTGPWSAITSTSIISSSIYCSKLNTQSNEEVILNCWAISGDGHSLCRLGVTPQCPRGLSWEHVSCEQPFIYISVGGNDNFIQVWATARDGSAFLRHGISRTCPAGTVWFHIESPRPKCPLKQVCVGKTSVWAVDEKHRLWFREEIVATFPEGTHWKKVDDCVLKICVNNYNDLWAIVGTQHNDSIAYKVAKRMGVSDELRVGTDWQTFNKHLDCFQFISSANNSYCDTKL